jgi:hypothetical protein
MAKGLTRKFLTALGIDEDKADQIIEQHTSVTDELKQERDSYKADAERLKEIETELNTTKATLKELKDAQGDNPFEKAYNDVKAEYENFKADVSAKETKAAKKNAYKDLLTELGIADKHIKSILKVTDVDSIELDKNGALKDRDALIKTVKDDYEAFIPTTGQQGANIKTPPANNGNAMTKEEIMAIKDDTERQTAIAANLELFS